VLSMAVMHARDECAQLLLGRGADVLRVDDNQQTAIHHAARTGCDARRLELLLGEWHDATAAAGTAQLATAGTAQLATAETGAGAAAGAAEGDGNACGQLDKWGRTPLHWATVNGHRDAIVALMQAGSDVWLKDYQRESAMDIAERRAECREWLNGQDGVRCDKLTLSMLKLMAT